MSTCLTCKWASWQMTNHKTPRINIKECGHCNYPAERIALPKAFHLSYVSNVTPEALARQYHVIWPGNPETNCRVWDKKDAL